jgi:Cd2+/Zn2+-exporting ATPase
LRRGQLNMNALMGVAVTGAFLIGQWPEAAMVMALYAIAELIEARSVDRARNAIKGLLDLTPETAEVRQADGTWLEYRPQRWRWSLSCGSNPARGYRSMVR